MLCQKGLDCLIHVLDSITEATGQLVLLNKNENILEDAHKIIYPGSNGDAWWDTAQLMAQVKEAIKIFKSTSRLHGPLHL